MLNAPSPPSGRAPRPCGFSNRIQRAVGSIRQASARGSALRWSRHTVHGIESQPEYHHGPELRPGRADDEELEERPIEGIRVAPGQLYRVVRATRKAPREIDYSNVCNAGAVPLVVEAGSRMRVAIPEAEDHGETSSARQRSGTAVRPRSVRSRSAPGTGMKPDSSAGVRGLRVRIPFRPAGCRLSPGGAIVTSSGRHVRCSGSCELQSVREGAAHAHPGPAHVELAFDDLGVALFGQQAGVVAVRERAPRRRGRELGLPTLRVQY